MCDTQDGLWICLPLCSTCGLYGSSTWKLNIKPGLSQEGGVMSERSLLGSAATSLWTVLVAGQGPCVTFGPSFPLFVTLESLPGAGIPGSVQDCWPLVTLECCGDLSLFPSSSPVVWGNRDWNRDPQGLLSLFWKKWCLIASWCQRAVQASPWTRSEDIPFNPACLFLPCSRESPRRGFGPAVLRTRLLSRLTYHR